jgi:Uncharacterized conserved protein (COG2071)
MMHQLKRHPVPISAFFRHSLVLTYAYPAELLAPLLPPGLELDTFNGLGFLAIAMVQTRDLRPSAMPAFIGENFFLTGYRIFARHTLPDGRSIRGLRILRSDTDKRLMTFFGNMLTHYNYHYVRATITEGDGALEIRVATPARDADLHVIADLTHKPAPLPEGSPFADLHEARRFAGPLPFTFDYERQTHSIVMIEGVRENWKPESVRVDVREAGFLRKEPFNRATPLLANAFHIENIPYRWKRGVREALRGEG